MVSMEVTSMVNVMQTKMEYSTLLLQITLTLTILSFTKVLIMQKFGSVKTQIDFFLLRKSNLKVKCAPQQTSDL